MSDQNAEALVRLNAMGVLTRREIEARLLGPLLRALSEEFGADRVLSITRQTIIEIARSQGAQLAQAMGGCSLAYFAASLDAWKKDDAMEIELTEDGKAYQVRGGQGRDISLATQVCKNGIDTRPGDRIIDKDRFFSCNSRIRRSLSQTGG